MATLVAPPEPYPQKAVDAVDWREAESVEQAWVGRIRAAARARLPHDPLAGEVVRWTRGDGYAEYMVWSEKPLTLVHLPIGDGYRVEAALIRGLTVREVRGMVEAQRRFDALFAGGAR
jgi:hypothetical protein